MTSNPIKIILYDKNDDPIEYIHHIANVSWEYNRIGGCGQCDATLIRSITDIDALVAPQTRVRIYINDEVRYFGKLVKISKSVKSRKEEVQLTFYGGLATLDKIIVTKTYTGMEVSAIVADILDNFVADVTDITYDTGAFEATDYSVASIEFNHTVKDALTVLTDLAGDAEWGVNQNNAFFFKRKDSTIRDVYVLGREVADLKEDRNDEKVTNVLNVYGADRELMTTLQAKLSVNLYGRREANIFESSLIEKSDADRYGTSLLKGLAGSQYSIKMTYLKPDEFVERTVPLGARSVTKNIISDVNKYGTSIQYGKGNKYGNLTRDQIQNIRYTFAGDGLKIVMTLFSDIPNIASQQKRIEYELRNLQRS